MNGKEQLTLEAVNAKVDQVLRILDDPDFGVRPRMNDHEKRLRSMEKWKYSLPLGGLLALAAWAGGLMKP